VGGSDSRPLDPFVVLLLLAQGGAKLDFDETSIQASKRGKHSPHAPREPPSPLVCVRGPDSDPRNSSTSRMAQWPKGSDTMDPGLLDPESVSRHPVGLGKWPNRALVRR
jgi:hypothetical protein